ncbi:hypothetical protein PIB30_048715, partial [Stylosanthes scabra]|nr:hypothetical protein [Stylosanthes scabra]
SNHFQVVLQFVSAGSSPSSFASFSVVLKALRHRALGSLSFLSSATSIVALILLIAQIEGNDSLSLFIFCSFRTISQITWKDSNLNLLSRGGYELWYEL